MTHPFTPGSSVSAYLRDSGGNRQELSVAQQEEHVRSWCVEHDLVLSHIFADVAQSGGSTVGRDQMDAMLKYFEQRPPDAGVVFWDYSRWARNYDDGQYLLSMLRRRGYLVHSLEEYVPPGPTGKIVESLHLWSAEQYREQLSKNVKRGLSYIVGNHHAYFKNRPPVGYRFVTVEIGSRRDGTPHTIHQIEPDPSTAPLVQRAFAMRAGGSSIGEIHEAIRLPYKTRTGYNRLLANRIYIGIYDYGGIAYPNYCQPLIDPNTWRAVQAVAGAWQSQSGAAHPRRATSRHLLTGLLRCLRCGSAMQGKRALVALKHGTKEYLYYHCAISTTGSNHLRTDRRCSALSIHAEALNERVYEAVKTHVLSEDVLSLAYAEAQARQASRQGEMDAVLTAARRNLAGLKAAIERLVLAISETGHSRSMLEKLTELERERDQEQIQVIDLEMQASTPLPDLDIGKLVREGLAIIERGDFRQKQLLLRSFVREVRVEESGGELVGEIDLLMPGGDGKVFSI